ncbi:MAG TPA: hypothetical protein DC047_06205 [Blastocatellia bacterium]|nr:hypothetical protein [Blastocatellia bacterium]
MNVTLEAIKFNHVPDSATVDAFNIRRNETEPVHVPEWRKGISVKPEDSPAAYAISETRGNTLTIKAKFKATGPGSPKVQVRAVEAREQHRQSLGCGPIGFVLRAFSTAQTAPVGNVLGVVRQEKITFNAAGETDFVTFKLSGVRLWSVGVSASTTNWRWQFRAKRSDRWTDFAVTSHRIYTVLEVPKEPWEQMPADETQLPWADALEYACDWGTGAHDLDEAATLVTHSVNDLGLSLVSYSGSSIYACPNFDCGKFLDLLQNGTGLGRALNCSDCATIVSSFANLLGCDLSQSLIGTVFKTNPIKKIGSQLRATTTFVGHEVAWKGDATPDDQVFDACVQVDGDPDPFKDPFHPLLATNLRFGKASEQGYRFRLSPPPPENGPDPCTPMANSKQRRPIGKSIPGTCDGFDAILLDFARQHYKFETWSDSDPVWQSLSIPNPSAEKKLFSGWELVSPPQHPKIINVLEVTQAVWRSLEKDTEALIRLDLFRCQTWSEARLFALQRLARFQELNVQRLVTPALGDIAFVESGEVSVLFVRSEHVIMMRSVGRVRFPVTEIAFMIDNHFLQSATTQNLSAKDQKR